MEEKSFPIFVPIAVNLIGFVLVITSVLICARKVLAKCMPSAPYKRGIFYFNHSFDDDVFTSSSTQTTLTYFNRTTKDRSSIENNVSEKVPVTGNSLVQDEKKAEIEAKPFDNVMTWTWNFPGEMPKDKKVVEVVEVHKEEGRKLEDATLARELQDDDKLSDAAMTILQVPEGETSGEGERSTNGHSGKKNIPPY